MIWKPLNERNNKRIGESRRASIKLPHIHRLVLMLVLTLLGLPALAAGNVLKEISYAALPGNSVQITLTAESAVSEPTSFVTDNPARIAMDFVGMKSGLANKTQPIGVGAARSVTAIEAGERTRVVVNLVSATGHTIDVRDNQVVITLEGMQSVAASSRPSAGPVVSNDTPVAMSSQRSVTNVDFRRGASGEGQVQIEMNDASAVVDMREEGGRIVLDILKTSLPEQFMRKFEVEDFATPVRMFEVTAQGDGVHVEIMPGGEYEYLAYQANELFTVEFRALTKEEKEAIERKKETFTGERLSLNFQDIEVRSVLQLLADFTGLNLVTSDTVGGRITLRLKNVPWDQALDIIMKTRGLAMRKNGNVMLIAPTEEIAAREKLELESQQQIEELAPLYSEYMQLNYAKAVDIQELLKGESNQLLTPERGNVTVDERTNTLLVRDTAAKLEDIRRLIAKLDIPVRQVLIESRVVLAHDDFAKDIGVRFGANVDATSGDHYFFAGGGQPGHLSGTLGQGAQPGIEYIAEGEGTGAEALLVNLPQTLSTVRGGGVNFLLGKVGSYLLQLELSAMQQEGKGEVVSSPRVITSNQNTAVIKQGIEIPYQEASSSGATSVSFKEAVLKLEVTPQITPDDRVILDLDIKKDEPDFTKAVLGVPPVNTQSVQTTVLVDNGETVVLGGVFEKDESTSTERVPFFGDLPYVGFMFKQEQRIDENSELLIFVTPKILKGELGLR